MDVLKKCNLPAQSFAIFGKSCYPCTNEFTELNWKVSHRKLKKCKNAILSKCPWNTVQYIILIMTWKLMQKVNSGLRLIIFHTFIGCTLQICTLVSWELWNFIVWQIKFNAFLHPNELPRRIFWYLVRQLDWGQSEMGSFSF